MYRGLRAAHLPTHYRHCQEGTMKEKGGVKEKGGERGRVFCIQGNHKEQDFQHLRTTKFSYITCHIKE